MTLFGTNPVAGSNQKDGSVGDEAFVEARPDGRRRIGPDGFATGESQPAEFTAPEIMRAGHVPSDIAARHPADSPFIGVEDAQHLRTADVLNATADHGSLGWPVIDPDAGRGSE
jgi:hypothetical protein